MALAQTLFVFDEGFATEKNKSNRNKIYSRILISNQYIDSLAVSLNQINSIPFVFFLLICSSFINQSEAIFKCSTLNLNKHQIG